MKGLSEGIAWVLVLLLTITIIVLLYGSKSQINELQSTGIVTTSKDILWYEPADNNWTSEEFQALSNLAETYQIKFTYNFTDSKSR